MIMINYDFKDSTLCWDGEFIKCSVKEILSRDSLYSKFSKVRFLLYESDDFSHYVLFCCDWQQIFIEWDFLYVFKSYLVRVGFNVDLGWCQLLENSNFEECFV